MAEHFVEPVEHDAVLEAEVVELAVEDGAVGGREDPVAAGRIRGRLDRGRGLPAQFSLVFSRRTNSYKLCNHTVSLETFDAIEQTNIVFDLCTQITKVSPIPPPPTGGCVPPPPVESKPMTSTSAPLEETAPTKGSAASKAGKSGKKE